MAIAGRLTAKSKQIMILLYAAFVCTLIFNVVAVYACFISPFVRDPFLRTEKFWRDRMKHEPWLMLFSIVFVYLNVCLYICSGFILISPIVKCIWPKIRDFLPWRLRRRTWCFCNCSCKSLVKILTSIHNTQCTNTPQTAETLDSTTTRYVHLIKENCMRDLKHFGLNTVLVGSSAEGLGRPYALELQKGYLDPSMKFVLRFFCCCLPCSTAYSSLRTDYDIILVNETKEENTEHFFKFEFDAQRKPGFVKLKFVDETSQFAFLCKAQDGINYVSSKRIRNVIRESIETTSESQLPASRIFGPFRHMPIVELEEKGPAIKLATYPLGQAWYWNENQRFVTFEGDFVFGFHVLLPFPDETKTWISRPRIWPSPTEIQSISEDGFILVPKTMATNDAPRDDNEWHISFPHSENRILRGTPKVAKACYLAMKLILKDHLVFYWKDFKTYYLKTMFLWELEKHSESFWCLENIDECFFALFDRVADCVASKKCPHYWVEGIDFFEQYSDCKDLTTLPGVLAKIRNNPSPYIEDVGSMWC